MASFLLTVAARAPDPRRISEEREDEESMPKSGIKEKEKVLCTGKEPKV